MMNQFIFLGKVLLLSAIISILIKHGLDNFLIQSETYLAPIIIFSPVIILFLILFIRQKKALNSSGN